MLSPVAQLFATLDLDSSRFNVALAQAKFTALSTAEEIRYATDKIQKSLNLTTSEFDLRAHLVTASTKRQLDGLSETYFVTTAKWRRFTDSFVKDISLASGESQAAVRLALTEWEMSFRSQGFTLQQSRQLIMRHYDDISGATQRAAVASNRIADEVVLAEKKKQWAIAETNRLMLAQARAAAIGSASPAAMASVLQQAAFVGGGYATGHAARIATMGAITPGMGGPVAAIGGALGVGLVLKALISDSSELDRSLAKVTANMKNMSDEAREGLYKQSLVWSTQFPMKVDDIIRSFAGFQEKGFDASQILALWPTYAKASTAAGGDFKDMIDHLTGAARVFYPTLESTKDRLWALNNVTMAAVAANRAGGTSVLEMTKALAKAGTEANKVGLDVWGAAAALAAFGQQSLESGNAGQVFSRVLVVLTHAANEHRDKWKEVVGEVFNYDGSLKKLDEVVPMLTKAVTLANGQIDQHKLGLLGIQSRSEQWVLQLLSAYTIINKVRGEMGQFGDSLDQVADKSMKNMRDQWSITLNNMLALVRPWGKLLAEALGESFGAINQAFSLSRRMYEYAGLGGLATLTFGSREAQMDLMAELRAWEADQARLKEGSGGGAKAGGTQSAVSLSDILDAAAWDKGELSLAELQKKLAETRRKQVEVGRSLGTKGPSIIGGDENRKKAKDEYDQLARDIETLYNKISEITGRADAKRQAALDREYTLANKEIQNRLRTTEKLLEIERMQTPAVKELTEADVDANVQLQIAGARKLQFARSEAAQEAYDAAIKAEKKEEAAVEAANQAGINAGMDYWKSIIDITVAGENRKAAIIKSSRDADKREREKQAKEDAAYQSRAVHALLTQGAQIEQSRLKSLTIKEETGRAHMGRAFDMERRRLDFDEKAGRISAATKLFWYNWYDEEQEAIDEAAIQRELINLARQGFSNRAYYEEIARLEGKRVELADRRALRILTAEQQSAALSISAWGRVESEIGRGIERSFGTFIGGLADLVFPRPSTQTDPLAPIVQSFREAYNQLAFYSNPRKALEDVIASIKNAGTAAAANAIAVKYFGAAAGPKLAAELRNGKISVDDITKAITEATKSTIEYEQKTSASTKNISTLWKQLAYDIALAILKTIIEYGLAVFLKWIFNIQDASIRLADVLAAVWKKITRSIKDGTAALREFADYMDYVRKNMDDMYARMDQLSSAASGRGSMGESIFTRYPYYLNWPDTEEPYDEGQEGSNYLGSGRSTMAILRPDRVSASVGGPSAEGGSSSRGNGDSFYIANLNVNANNADELVRQLKALKVVKGLT